MTERAGSARQPDGGCLRGDVGHSSDEGSEQGGNGARCGVAGAKAGDRRESARPKHGPDTEPGNRDTGGRTDTAARVGRGRSRR